MSIELKHNGVAAQGMVTTSWVRDEYANGRKRFTVYAMHVPVMQAVAPGGQIDVSRPRLAGAPAVIGQLILEVPNLEVAKMLCAALGETLAAQPPEILQIKGA
jgi:hypothetical protein